MMKTIARKLSWLSCISSPRNLAVTRSLKPSWHFLLSNSVASICKFRRIPGLVSLGTPFGWQTS